MTENDKDHFDKITPLKPKTKSDILKSTALGLMVPLFALAIRFILDKRVQKDPFIAWVLLAGFSVFILAINLFTKLIQTITINNKDKILQVNYSTLFKTNIQTTMHFTQLSYKYNAKTIQHPPKRFELKLLNNNRNAFTIDTAIDGYSIEQLEELTKKLESMGIKEKR